MKLKPMPSRLKEVQQLNGAIKYILTINDAPSVCPFQSMSIPCSTLCPHFVVDDENNKVLVTLSCGNGNAYHTIHEILNLND